jgi:hypothetical protein
MGKDAGGPVRHAGDPPLGSMRYAAEARTET